MKRKTSNSRALNVAISWGASIVIIGVLFKILHIGGVYANYMIGIGLGVEALLFILMGFNPPAEQPDWSRVFPQLDPDFKGEIPSQAISAQPTVVNPSFSATTQIDKLFSDANVDAELIKKLAFNLTEFTSKIESINNIADISISSQNFVKKMDSASSNLDQLSRSVQVATSDVSSIAETKVDMPNYKEQLINLTENLSRLNKMYSSNVTEIAEYHSSVIEHTRHLKASIDNMSQSSKDAESVKQQMAELNSNLTTLNRLYENMIKGMKFQGS